MGRDAQIALLKNTNIMVMKKNVNIVIHLVMDQVARIVLQRSIDTEVVIISVVGVAQLVLDPGVQIVRLKNMKNKKVLIWLNISHGGVNHAVF